MLRINRKEQRASAHCIWYVFILGGVAIHLTVYMPRVSLCVRACVCASGPEANLTRLCIHYLPRWQHYRVIAHENRVNVYHRKRFSWSKITAETEHVVPVSAGADKLSPQRHRYDCFAQSESARSKLFVCHRCSGVLKRVLFFFFTSSQGSDWAYVNTGWQMWFKNLLSQSHQWTRTYRSMESFSKMGLAT